MVRISRSDSSLSATALWDYNPEFYACTVNAPGESTARYRGVTLPIFDGGVTPGIVPKTLALPLNKTEISYAYLGRAVYSGASQPYAEFVKAHPASKESTLNYHSSMPVYVVNTRGYYDTQESAAASNIDTVSQATYPLDPARLTNVGHSFILIQNTE
jgi:hypothetical protein